MTRKEAMAKLDAITAALAGVDDEANVISVGFGGSVQPYIQICGRNGGLERMKMMAWENHQPLVVAPDFYELGDKAYYEDGGVEVMAIIVNEE